MLPNLNSWLKVLNKKWTHYISNDNNFPLSEIPNWTWQLECLLPHLQCDTTSAPSTLKALHGKSSEVTSTKVPFKLKIARWIKGGYYYEHSLNTCPLKWVFMFTQSQFKFHFLGIKRKWWRRAFPHLESHESEHAFAQSCPTLCNLMDCRGLGSFIHGIFQARILQWVATSFSRGSSQPRDQTQVSHIAGILLTLTIWATRKFLERLKNGG